VTVLEPDGSEVTASFAVPFTSVAVPRLTAPAVKVTDPVGTAVADRTIAVKFTDSPAADGFTEETICVVVAARLTIWFKVLDVLLAEAVSPL